MQLYSTNNRSHVVTFEEAIFKGLPEDKGLYMPIEWPRLNPSWIEALPGMTMPDIALEVASRLIGDEIPAADLKAIIDRAVNFPAPIVPIEPGVSSLELFHGPSLAFKDFGARFMAEVMSYFNRSNQRELTILVATSGDTGGAVAAGFYKTPGIRVVILYPSGKVSPLQEKQLTTLGHNITALEVDGTFDDCQALVKQAFLDTDINSRQRLSSANSINIARLIPQSFYYFEAYRQVVGQGLPVVFCVPSGNFGNLTAGLFAQRMGLPVQHFIAATNSNDVVPAYLHTGTYTPRPSVRTLSNAMDVGAPSNFARMLDLYRSEWGLMKQDISGYAYDDAATEATIREVFARTGYMLEPHGAVGYMALKAWQSDQDVRTNGIVLETAHPAKFLEDMERILDQKVPVPQRLAELADHQKVAVPMGKDFAGFKDWLLQH
jgi:threonine synthase